MVLDDIEWYWVILDGIGKHSSNMTETDAKFVFTQNRPNVDETSDKMLKWQERCASTAETSHQQNPAIGIPGNP